MHDPATVRKPNDSAAAGLLCLCALALVLGASPLLAQSDASPDSLSITNLVDTLGDLSCEELHQVFYQEIPPYVYDDQSDALYELVIHLADRCEFGELLGRIQILASIWDGNFQEIIYGYEIIGWLIERYDPAKRPRPGSDGEAYDTFTTEFANQMLPHVESGTLEEFFCLYYSGNTEGAWLLLQSDDLADTWLRYYYDEEVDILKRMTSPYIVGLHGGLWQPSGDQEFAGGKNLIGASVEQRWSRWFARLVIEGRVGRTDEPYFVNHEVFAGYSDRWDALLFAVEGGFGVWQSGPHLADVFVGVGYDAVRPFKSQDFGLASVNLAVGLGYRLHLTASRRWFVGIDGRYEVVGDRNPDGTPLGGSALSGRLGLGFALAADPEPRLRALGYSE